MRNFEISRRDFVQQITAAAALTGAPGLLRQAIAAEGLRYWASAIAKVGAKDFSAMEQQSGTPLAVTTKSAR